MAYTLYAPNKIVIKTAELADQFQLLALPQLARFIPANILANPDVQTNRSVDANPDAPAFSMLRLVLNSTDFDMDYLAELTQNIVIWATRCRIMGVRGQRLAIVSEPDVNRNTIEFTVLLGSVVLYNERRATVSVSVTNEELLMDLENLYPHVETFGVDVESVMRLSEDGTSTPVYPDDANSLTMDELNVEIELDNNAFAESTYVQFVTIGAQSAQLLVAHKMLGSDMLSDHLDELQVQVDAASEQLVELRNRLNA